MWRRTVAALRENDQTLRLTGNTDVYDEHHCRHVTASEQPS
jgi:hypothetical protein